MDNKRPTTKDTDEDLIKFQNEFLSSRSKPAVTIVKPTSKDKPSTKEGATASTSKETKDEVLEEPPSVLLKISEHQPNYNYSSTDFQVKSEISFPRPFKRTIDQAEPQITKGRKSIFAQEMKKRKGAARSHASFGSCLQQEKTNLNIQHQDIPDQSHIVDGTGLNSTEESKKIHQENLQKLKTMSKEEIEEHKKQILSHLDPKIIEFLRSRNKDQQLNQEAKDKPQPTKKVSFSTEEVKMDAEESSEAEIPEDELPITPEQIKANKWLGMNKIEWKKLEWMKSLPEPKPFDPQTGNSARFDLEGNLITGKTNVPIHLGLHHHGDEPEKPGYTFEELFRLTRSGLAPQRCLALNTMSHILSLNSKGRFDDVLTEPLLPQLIQSGLVTLLRYAIDDEQASVWTAGVAALHSLLVSQVDEEALDQVFPWTHGHVCPFLCPEESPIIVEIEDEDEQIEKLKDHEIVQKDVILGLMRMDLLPRLRYLIEVLKPDTLVVDNILGILIRVARHSPQLSEHLYKCPGLIEAICSSFLPLHWTTGSNVNSYDTITSSRMALKLMRILASADVIIAERLLIKHKIDTTLRSYLACNPNDDRTTLNEMLKLSVEALRTWKTFLHYGLTTEIFFDLFPIFMGRIEFCQNLSSNDISHRGDLNFATAFISSLSTLTKLSDIINEGQFVSVLSLIIQITKKWTLEMIEACPSDMSEGWSALSASLDFLKSFFETFVSSAEEYQHEFDQFKMIVEKLITHSTFAKISSKIKVFSSLLDSNITTTSSRYPNALPQTGAVLLDRKIANVLNVGSFVQFQVSLSGALLYLAKNHPNLNKNVFAIYFNELGYYLKRIYEKFQKYKEVQMNLDWFSKFEMILVVNALQIIGTGNVSSVDVEFYHELSLTLPPFVLTILGEEWLNKLLDFAIFNPVYYTNSFMDEVRNRLATLRVTDTQPINKSNLEKNLCRIKSNYSIAFNWRFTKPTSSSLVQIPFKASKLNKTSPWRRSNALKEWIFLPLTMENLENNAVSVERCLDWIFFLMKNRKTSFTRLFTPGKIFTNIATIFLMEGEPFLIPEIKMILSDILSFYINNWPTPLLNEAEIGFPILELFEELINHFEATSYGDKLYANLIIIFLQAAYPPQFKTLFFKEHRMALTFIRLNLTESMLPIHLFLTPLECNEEVLEIYFQMLLSGAFSRIPLLQAIAMHHLYHYLFSTESAEERFRNKALKTLAGLQNKNKSCDDLLKFREICLITRTVKYYDEIPSNVAENLLNFNVK